MNFTLWNLQVQQALIFWWIANNLSRCGCGFLLLATIFELNQELLFAIIFDLFALVCFLQKRKLDQAWENYLLESCRAAVNQKMFSELYMFGFWNFELVDSDILEHIFFLDSQDWTEQQKNKARKMIGMLPVHRRYRDENKNQIWAQTGKRPK